jgi:hypothetical protein
VSVVGSEPTTGIHAPDAQLRSSVNITITGGPPVEIEAACSSASRPPFDAAQDFHKIVAYIVAHGAGNVGETHAYSDGAASYKVRADKLKAKGDKKGYP